MKCRNEGPIDQRALQDIRDRVATASAGPWRVIGYGNVCDVSGERRIGKLIPAADAEFVAAARTDVPLLLAEIDRLTRLIADAGYG